jgi:homoserine dehydrogenase
VNRLRLLAYDGLLAQNGVLVSDGLAARADGHGAGAEEGASAVTNDLFAPAIEA